jgi:hypothetical protein
MKAEILIFQATDNRTAVKVQFDNQTVWLTQAQMVILFERDQSVISRHIRNIFEEGELEEKSNMQNIILLDIFDFDHLRQILTNYLRSISVL